MLKVKGKKKRVNLKCSKRKITCYIQRNLNRAKSAADFSAEIIQARRESHDIFKVPEEKNFQQRTLYPAKLLFKIEGERVSKKQKLKEIIATTPALQEILMCLCKLKRKDANQ